MRIHDIQDVVGNGAATGLKKATIVLSKIYDILPGDIATNCLERRSFLSLPPDSQPRVSFAKSADNIQSSFSSFIDSIVAIVKPRPASLYFVTMRCSGNIIHFLSLCRTLRPSPCYWTWKAYCLCSPLLCLLCQNWNSSALSNTLNPKCCYSWLSCWLLSGLHKCFPRSSLSFSSHVSLLVFHQTSLNLSALTSPILITPSLVGLRDERSST